MMEKRKMAGIKLKLKLPKVAARIDELHAREPDGWRKTRLLAVKLAARGESTSAQIADVCGIARGHVFVWLKIVRTRGLDALLERSRPGPQKGVCRGVPAKVLAALRRKLEANAFASAAQARRWLQEEHHIERPYISVWRWLKKCGGVLRVPRPSHSGKKPGAEQQFQATLGAKLAALGLAAGSRVKVWVMDEARFGLHTELRRVWTPRGQRPVVARQIKYQWDYLYGALAVIGGDAHFAHVPSVSLAWDEGYLQDLAASDAQAVHVLIRDQAGFHLRDGDARLPARVRIIDLPPYTPELNPCEQLWDLVKDELANRIYATITTLRAAMQATLRRFWDDPGAVLRLIGRDWLQVQLNASHAIHLSY
jgi:transposase